MGIGQGIPIARIAMKENPAINRFAALSVRTDVSLGILRSSRIADFNLMLAAAAQTFAPGRRYQEREVNDILKNWLAREGSMLALDHVGLRRWLVDCRVLARDDYGRAYALGQPAPEIAALVSVLSGVDLAAVAEAARTRDASVRAVRKSEWNTGKRGAVVKRNEGSGEHGG
jgi:hypothetical protein